MTNEINVYGGEGKNIIPLKTVSIPISLYESTQGRYFVGQTESLYIGSALNAWAGIFNPLNSNINLYANVYTISNFSDDYLIAEIWLNAEFDQKGAVSHKVSAANTSLKPIPKNRAEIRYIQSTTATPQGGVNVYERIVPPKATLVAEEDGKFIEESGGNYTLYIKSFSDKLDKAVVAFGWWEK